ncbi:MAG: YicC family protein [Bacteroidales bacterium]|nr:YicC family protein [Bacteroidales bacterium]MCL2133512.1 YicC family protein [Bacteroidales bacterium]
MAKSMTGYGKHNCTYNTKQFSIEIRSVNGKSLDVNIKFPINFRDKEGEIRNQLNKVAQRGKIDVFMTVDASSVKSGFVINKAAFTAYLSQLEQLLKEEGAEFDRSQLVSSILRLPDVMNQEPENLDEQEWKAVFECFNKALAAFDNFRSGEGKIIMQDILQRITLIEQLLAQIAPYENERLETVKQRILTNLEQIPGVEYDKNRFEQELIYYIEKFDITEEKIRLKQHCAYFLESAKSEEAPGRKLGFIAQEIGREINTLGSKANHVEIQRIVVQMKDELEKIKEQLLNVL